MSYIYDQINSDSHFYRWLQGSSYQNSFSYDGAIAVQAYYQNLAEDMDQPVEFDPIAWCGECVEYEDLEALKIDYPIIESIDDLQDHTMVISESPIVFIQF